MRGNKLIIYDPVTGHKKGVCDDCIDPYRANCRGCEYSFAPELFDGGCLAGYSEKQRNYLKDRAREYAEAWRQREKESLLKQADAF